jgi:uncharacterized protein YgiM (DUF1202 family)
VAQAYDQWEADHARLAEQDLEYRLAAQAASDRKLEVSSGYAQWEAQHADLAEAELAQRLLAAQRADEQLAIAKKAAEQAQLERAEAANANAESAVQAQLQADAERADANLTIARDQATEASRQVEQARAQALVEVQQKQRAATEAISARQDQRAADIALAMNVTEFPAIKLAAATDVNIRRGPGVGYEQVGELALGTEVTVTGRGNGFYRLADGNFVSEKFLVDPTAIPQIHLSSPAADEEPEVQLSAEPGRDSAANSAADAAAEMPDVPLQSTKSKPNPKPKEKKKSKSKKPAAKAKKTKAKESSPYAWETYIANVDAQRAIDACTGGVTYSPEISQILGKAYYPIHVHCHGQPILGLKNGDLVRIQSVGVFRVVGSKDVKKGDSTRVIAGLPGDALLQTCYPNDSKMRVVAIQKV